MNAGGRLGIVILMGIGGWWRVDEPLIIPAPDDPDPDAGRKFAQAVGRALGKSDTFKAVLRQYIRTETARKLKGLTTMSDPWQTDAQRHAAYVQARRKVRADAAVGAPWVPLPGNPPNHKVVFESPGGFKYRALMVEQVWNDAARMDFVDDAPGAYLAAADGLTKAVYQVAVHLYGRPPKLPEERTGPGVVYGDGDGGGNAGG